MNHDHSTILAASLTLDYPTAESEFESKNDDDNHDYHNDNDVSTGTSEMTHLVDISHDDMYDDDDLNDLDNLNNLNNLNNDINIVTVSATATGNHDINVSSTTNSGRDTSPQSNLSATMTDDDSDDININQQIPLPLPYDKNSITERLWYYYETFFVTNRRLLSLSLLYTSIWPRILAIVDMYTDIRVTIDLYQKQYISYFSLSLLFISFSFVMVWSVSLRFIEKYINYKKIKIKSKGYNIIINIVIILYLFPPIGCLCVTLYEIFYLFYDTYLGLSSFMNGNILVIDKDASKLAFKQFRRIVEFFGMYLLFVVCYTLRRYLYYTR